MRTVDATDESYVSATKSKGPRIYSVTTEGQDRHQLPHPVLSPGPPEQTLDKANEWCLHVNL